MSGPKRIHLELDGAATTAITLERLEGPDRYEARVSSSSTDAPLLVSVLRRGTHPLVLVDGRVVSLALCSKSGETELVHSGTVRTARSVKPTSARSGKRPAESGGSRVTAPMPGRIVQLNVRVGDRVEQGTPLLVLEAMKMQNAVFAQAAGLVAKVLVAEGEKIERGAVLLELDLTSGDEPGSREASEETP